MNMMFLGNPMKKAAYSRDRASVPEVTLPIPQEEVQGLPSVHGSAFAPSCATPVRASPCDQFIDLFAMSV
jgi:hypothetical protein